jgi:hypothetical protein
MLFFILVEFGKLNLKASFSKIGIVTFLGGVFLTELLLFSQGFLILLRFSIIQHYNLFILIASIFMLVGLVLIYFPQLKTSKKVVS